MHISHSIQLIWLKKQERQEFHKNKAIYSKHHVTVMAMDMLQQVAFPPNYLTSLSMYMVLHLRELIPKVLTI